MYRLLPVLMLMLLGCGGEVSNPDDPIDAADTSNDCESYCGCMVGTCEEEDALTCIEDCLELEVDVLDCRLVHCGLAQAAEEDEDEAALALHCGHARGVGMCEAAN